MSKSGIQWTDRSDWNPLRGCTRVSPGCVNCYAEAIAGRFSAPGQPFHGFAERTSAGARWTGKVELIENRLTLPLRWRKPARIFVNSAFDLFHEAVPDEVIDRVFAVMALAPQHTFQVLTKRSARMREWMTICRDSKVEHIAAAKVTVGFTAYEGYLRWPLPNVWLGVSVEDQQRADERIPDLLATPAAVRWLSCEPLLGPVDWIKPVARWQEETPNSGKTHIEWGAPLIDWIVAGGESGRDARPMHPDWARALRDQCEAAGAAFFFKQWGEWYPYISHPSETPGRFAMMGISPNLCSHTSPTLLDAYPRQFNSFGSLVLERLGKARAGRRLDGREWNDFPQTESPKQ